MFGHTATHQPNMQRQVGIPEEQPASLGNLPNISATSTKQHTLSSQFQKKKRRFRLADWARHLMRKHNVLSSRTGNAHRTRYCMMKRIDKSLPVGITLNNNPKKSNAGLSNVKPCDSICSCPVCAHKLMSEHATMIQKALKYAELNGLVPIMVTLTAQHHKGMKLEDFVADFKAAWRMFSNHRTWKQFKSDYGIEHWIAAREVTRDAIKDNGWHYHMHILLFLDGSKFVYDGNVNDIDVAFTGHWLHCLESQNLSGLPERACDVRAGAGVSQHYLTKLGLTENAKGKLEYELAGSENKGKTIWDVLAHAEEGDIKSEYQFIEYVTVMQGENWITTSHGLRKLIADIQLESEEIDEDDKLMLWAWIDPQKWLQVVQKRRVHEVLTCAARYRCRKKLNECIRLICDD